MKRASRTAAFAVAIAIALSAAPAAGQSAADKETARTLFETGKKKRDAGDFSGALEAFKAADALMHVPTTKLAMARAYVSLGRLIDGREAALQVAQIPVAAKEPAPFTDARSSAAQLATELASKIPTLTVTVAGSPNADDAAVTIDEQPIPKEALKAPRKLDPGKHVIVATLGGQRSEQSVDLAESQALAVRLEIAGDAPREAAAPVTEEKKKPNVLLFAGLGLAVVGVGVGAAFGIVSMGHKSDADASCRDGKCPPPAYDALDAANTTATISTIGFVAAGVGVGIAAAGLLLAKKPAAQTASPQVTPVIGAGSAAIVGTF
jgi:hypothetical protein